MMIVVFGNHGELSVDPVTGEVVDYVPGCDGNGYADIVRIDLDEWRSFYPGEVCEGGDILDFGFWTNTGDYAEPVADWREEYRNDLKDGKIGDLLRL